MKRIILFAVLAVVLLIGAGSALVGSVGVSVSEADIQKRVDAALPLTLSRLGGTVEVRTVALNTREDGTVEVSGSGDVRALGLDGDVAFSGVSRIVYEDGAFYLRDLGVEDVRITPTAETAERVEGRKKLLSTAVQRLRETVSGGDTESEEAFDAEGEALIALVKSRVAEAADRFISQTPVYDLKNGSFKVRMAAHALKGVSVNDAGITVEISPFKFFLFLMKNVGLAIIATLFGLGMLIGFFRPSRP